MWMDLIDGGGGDPSNWAAQRQNPQHQMRYRAKAYIRPLSLSLYTPLMMVTDGSGLGAITRSPIRAPEAVSRVRVPN